MKNQRVTDGTDSNKQTSATTTTNALITNSTNGSATINDHTNNIISCINPSSPARTTHTANIVSATPRSISTTPHLKEYRKHQLSGSQDSLLNVTVRKKCSSATTRPGSATSFGIRTINSLISGGTASVKKLNKSSNNNNNNHHHHHHNKPLVLRRAMSKDSIDSIGISKKEREKENRRKHFLLVKIYFFNHRN